MKITILLALGLAASTHAGIILNSSFVADDQTQLFNVALINPGVLTVRSAGYGGDSSLAIKPGGFDTVLSLFATDPSGILLALNTDGACPPFSPDPVTGFCLDAFLSTPLPSGNYVVALTQYDNLPLGPALKDGFSQEGQGNFTPGLSGFPGVSFLDQAGNQRTGNWTLIFNGADIVTTVPEPGSLELTALFGGLFILLARSRLRTRSTPPGAP
ncbi:MAG: DVUA0089 family protein [Bryobacteraceae bacterium]|nr:DVUA0089 family protein [Bryobacteraceae bacterium]